MKLESSIPSNNLKIIELYNKIESGSLNPSPSFQRKLVWKAQHKYNFIKTILDNFPFPEIYIAPDSMDTKTLKIKEVIVDGQQRCSAIVNYIKGEDVFVSSNTTIKSFDNLSEIEKESFLNYSVSIRDLKNANSDQVKDIFQRINSTDYSLNKVEKNNAQWGDSEFLLFAKQITEEPKNLDQSLISYNIKEDNLTIIKNLFEKNKVFSDADYSRMQATQYIMTLVATILDEEYTRRNYSSDKMIETFNEEFIGASEIEIKLTHTASFINKMELNSKSYWYNKANLFSLIVVISKYETNKISDQLLKIELDNLEQKYHLFKKNEPLESKDRETLLKYFEYAKEAVNEITARKFRGDIINKMIAKCLH